MPMTVHVERWAWRLLVMLLVAMVVLFGMHAWVSLHTYAPLDYGEGPLLHQARLLLQGQPLYRPSLSEPPYTITNYPPLYQTLVAMVGAIAGFSYETGRWVSVVATVLAMGALWALVQALTGERRAAAIAAMLLVAFPFAFYWGVLGRVDMLALALSLWGIWWAVRWPGTWWGLIGAALLLTAAAFTRQSYLLAAPLAVCCWLAAHEWRWAARFVGLMGLLVGALTAFALWWTKGGFWVHVVVANRNQLNWWQVLAMAYLFLLTAAPIAVVACVEAMQHLRRREKIAWLLLGYFMGASLSALTVAKVGSNVNYWLEIVAACILLVGVGMARWRREMSPWERLIPLGLVLLFVVLAWRANSAIVRETEWVQQVLVRDVRDLEAMVCATPGPVIAEEMMSILVVCKKEIVFQPFEYTRLAEEGIWDQRPFLTAIRAQQFDLILISDGRWENPSNRWTPEMLDAIQKAYFPAERRIGTIVYRPAERSP